MSASRGVLLDLDGTLMDTTYLHTVFWWQAIREHGRTAPMAPIHRAVGMGADQLLDHVLGSDRDHSADEDITARHDALFAERYADLDPLPGGRDLLQALRAHGLVTVLASSASEKDLSAELDRLEAHDSVQVATTSADAEATKPSPDILSAALEQSGLKAEDVVYVGDAVWDVQAAARLGIPCVGLESGGTSSAELLDAGAVETYADPAALARDLDRSVIGRLARDGRPG